MRLVEMQFFLGYGKLKKVFILGEPLFRDDGYFTVREGKLLYSVEDVFAQLNERNLVWPEVGESSHIEPVVVFHHFNIQGGFSYEEVFISRFVFDFKAMGEEKVLFVAQPFEDVVIFFSVRDVAAEQDILFLET